MMNESSYWLKFHFYLKEGTRPQKVSICFAGEIRFFEISSTDRRTPDVFIWHMNKRETGCRGCQAKCQVYSLEVAIDSGHFDSLVALDDIFISLDNEDFRSIKFNHSYNTNASPVRPAWQKYPVWAFQGAIFYLNEPHQWSIEIPNADRIDQRYPARTAQDMLADITQKFNNAKAAEIVDPILVAMLGAVYKMLEDHIESENRLQISDRSAILA